MKKTPPRGLFHYISELGIAMDGHKKSRQIKPTRLIAVAAVVLGVLFAFAYGAQVLEAIRLRNWRDRLQSEVEQLERKQADSEQEVARHASVSQRELELFNSGWSRDDLVGVIVETATPGAAEGGTPTAVPSAEQTLVPHSGTTLFDNENWYAWRRLLRGFD